jgi:hypothetical protein
VSIVGLFVDGIYRLNLTYDNQLSMIDPLLNQHNNIVHVNNTYLLDYDVIENHLYFARCARPIRPILMSCSNTRGIYRVNLTANQTNKQVDMSDVEHIPVYDLKCRLSSIDMFKAYMYKR